MKILLEIPDALEGDRIAGWTYNYEFLERVSIATMHSGEYLSMEGVEEVFKTLRELYEVQ